MTETNENESTRKIICFVCVQELPDVNSWRSHIVENHLEGRDFLACPTCGIPCRDLTSHFKVHHRGVEMPVFEKSRIDNIRDWDEKYRVSLLKKRKWKEGLFDSLKMGKKIHYRSSWERDVMICLEKCVDIDEYYGDDHLCIPYNLHGSTHRYWPDFTVKLRGGDTIILEIKPEDQTEWEINQFKWKYAVEYCNARQWDFQVWTQKYIRKIKTRAVRNDVLLREHVIPSKEEMIKEININGQSD